MAGILEVSAAMIRLFSLFASLSASSCSCRTRSILTASTEVPRTSATSFTVSLTVSL